MSQENVERVYGVIDAYNRRDLDAFLAVMGPDVEFTPYERAIEGLGPYVGEDGVRAWWNEAFEVFPNLNAEIYEVHARRDTTLVRGRLRGQGAGSGAPIERLMWLVIRWRDGKVSWWHAFQSQAEALKAAGIEE